MNEARERDSENEMNEATGRMDQVEDELVTIAVFPEPMEASMARSALESAGFRVFMLGETANSLIPVAFPSQLQVHAEDEQAARSLLRAMEDNPETLESVTAAEIADEDVAR